jgi:hypothetical protein
MIQLFNWRNPEDQEGLHTTVTPIYDDLEECVDKTLII